MRGFLVLVTLLASWGRSISVAAEIPPVLVVYNATVADSVELAQAYARAYELPDDHLCGLVIPAADMITRSLYEKAVEQAVGRCLLEAGLQDEVLYLVLMQGTPLGISGDRGRVGDLASVDSELTLLYRKLVGYPIETFGKVENPYFHFDPEAPFPAFRREDFDIYLVTRLTGPDPATVGRLVAGARSGEPAGADRPARVGVDLPSPGSSMLHDWMRTGAEGLRRQGLEVQLDQSGGHIARTSPWAGFVLVTPFDPAGPPAAAMPRKLEPRAVGAVLFHEAGTQGNPSEWLAASRSAAFELLAHGAEGTFFFVGDPTVDGYPRPQLVLSAYFAGRTWAESAYAGTRYLSWRVVVVGDPLLRWTTSPDTEEGGQVRQVDPETGFTEPFATRRKAFLVQRYRTTPESASLLLRAEKARLDHSPDEALRMVQACINADPRLVEAYLLQAELLEEAGRIREAAAAYEAALERSEIFRPLVTERLVRLLVNRLHEVERAEPFAARLVQERGIGDLELARLWGEILLALKRWDEAEQLFLRWVQGTRTPPAFALQGLGDIARQRGNFVEARTFYTRAMEAPGAELPALQSRLALLPPEAGGESAGGKGAKAAGEATSSASEHAAESAAVVPAAVRGGGPLTEVQVVHRNKGRVGRVVLRIFLDEHGQVMDLEPIGGTKSLYREAEKLARAWRYRPRLVNGRAVPGWEQLTIEFRRDGN